MAGTDLLLDWTILFEVGYLILDAFVNFDKKNREMTARRIVVVSLLSLLGSSILLVLVGQVNQDLPAFTGPLLSAVWIALLFLVFRGSWMLYHSMLAYSGRL
ncbi:MAG: hypothetical protein JRN58_00830 [Nitrososphaerota archaeon]|nr:hypothetical protein [Nitrososphaerota archaeon]MDG6977608.1 hypothetical protein [Nitrososphaerota archaeon]